MGESDAKTINEVIISQETLVSIRQRAEAVLAENVLTETGDAGYRIPSGRVRESEFQGQILYPHQWNWDTFAIVAASLALEQGKIDVKHFLSCQRSDGFLPHILYNLEILTRGAYFPPATIYELEGKLPENRPITSKITQPPLVAYGVWEMAKRLPLRERREFIEEVFPKVFKYHAYLYENRVRDGLMIVIHPWEQAQDNSPIHDPLYRNFSKSPLVKDVLDKWLAANPLVAANIGSESFTDQAIYYLLVDWLGQKLHISYERIDKKLIKPSQRPTDRDYDKYLFLIYLYNNLGWDDRKILSQSPYLLIDPLTNAILLKSDQALMAMARELGKGHEAEVIGRWMDETRLGLENLWDQERGFYLSYDYGNQTTVKVATTAGLMPVFTGLIPREHVDGLARLIGLIIREFPGCYLVPSTLPTEKEFNRECYWRGPVWTFLNEFLSKGFSLYGYHGLARRIRLDSLRLVAKSMGNPAGDFNEYFDAFTGKGYGASGQSWTAALIQETVRNYLDAKADNPDKLWYGRGSF